MRFSSDKDLELAEDADPAVFPSERSRRRAIGFDRWSGRHPVLITLLTGAGVGVLLWLALLNAPADRFAVRLVFYVAVVVLVTVGIARLALKARKKYYGR
ncbi:hypothetical protein [Saccharothrix variisporea]|uniref:Uncharacterized protein n=1 Tax=Saccharothrix variisporea TaxID=543527 RepID=A0A495XCD6_9PSEU|nr:hypothetical protein [Saccharothrix variisporea]RKT69198.1 hypothetical protein DFJ66_2394 [Saccharothrix variisporea]